ncbi:UPF0481 protein At3g47200-like [Macadamia integrifolia]|uniref:UPF0481 protein At3g47200-like n=1 Tax=Macadamia integrifolia TaxID=60698 RepID=UPI001C501675|nr:UPF0481 protein At3g47200-like [Macadamia integrifolia]
MEGQLPGPRVYQNNLIHEPDLNSGISSINIELISNKLSLSRNSNTTIRPTYCIYRVNKRIRKVNEDAYTPDTVSIGPYHRDKQNSQMKAMEKLKWRYVHALLDRTSERSNLENYVEVLKELETEARGFYSEPSNLSSGEFIEMMLFDGLFIIELFRKYAQFVERDCDDPIFYSNFRTRVVRDLVLLENQIPMSVLQALFDLSYDPHSHTYSLIRLALFFFKDLIPDGMYYYPYPQNKESIIPHNHLLDLLSYTLENSLPPMVMKPASRASLESLPCATELRDSGVKFKKRLRYGGWMDMKFNEGVFEIPPLCVDEYTDPFFRNLIAYQQHRFGGGPYITSYALLMDYLIKSSNDVALLRGRGIIMNHLGDDDKVSSLFKSICCEIFTNNFCYSDLCDKVREYYNRPVSHPINNWKASFKRIYCKSPWTIIPLVAAFLLLFLTAWSTLFTTLPVYGVNYKHKS